MSQPRGGGSRHAVLHTHYTGNRGYTDIECRDSSLSVLYGFTVFMYSSQYLTVCTVLDLSLTVYRTSLELLRLRAPASAPAARLLRDLYSYYPHEVELIPVCSNKLPLPKHCTESADGCALDS